MFFRVRNIFMLVVCVLLSIWYDLACGNNWYEKYALPFLNTCEATAKHLQLSS